MTSFDTIVIGGGPAGSTTARSLASAGMRVLVLDRATFPRDKVCAGWITPPVIEALDIDLSHYRTTHTLQPITGFRTGLVNGSDVETTYDHPVSYGIRRCEFDRYLLERSNATLALGQPLSDLRRAKGRWTVNGAYEAPIIIGAGGHFCPVARRLAATSSSRGPIVAAQEIEFPLDATSLAGCRVKAETPELYFSRDLAGYGWCFKKGGYLNVGIGRLDRERLPDHARQFIDWLIARGTLPTSVPRTLKGHAYHLYGGGSSRPLLDDGVLLVGDAAGLAYPESGEGIRTAVESGLLAARTVIDAAGRYDRARLDAYRGAIEGRFGSPTPASRARSPLAQSFIAAVGARLLVNRWFARRVVLDRWFLHASQPALHARG